MQVRLVGGFSASPYLQQRAKAELTAAATFPPAGLKSNAAATTPTVMTMEEPYAAVLQGTGHISTCFAPQSVLLCFCSIWLIMGYNNGWMQVLSCLVATLDSSMPGGAAVRTASR